MRPGRGRATSGDPGVGKSAPAEKRSRVKSGIAAARPAAVVAPPRPPPGSLDSPTGRGRGRPASRAASRESSTWWGSIDAGLFGSYTTSVPHADSLRRGGASSTRRERNPKIKPWIFLSSARGASKKDDERCGVTVERLPVIVVVESEVAPVDCACEVSLQGDRRDFSSFRDAGLGWAKNEDVYFLQSFSLRFDPDDVHALLPIKRPSVVDAIEPLPVKDVEVEYKGRAAFAQTKNGAIHAIGLEEDLDLSTDLDPLVATVKAAKQVQRERNADRVRAEREFFIAHGSRASYDGTPCKNDTTARASLEATKVYEVCPRVRPRRPCRLRRTSRAGSAGRRGRGRREKCQARRLVRLTVDGFFREKGSWGSLARAPAPRPG